MEVRLWEQGIHVYIQRKQECCSGIYSSYTQAYTDTGSVQFEGYIHEFIIEQVTRKLSWYLAQ